MSHHAICNYNYDTPHHKKAVINKQQQQPEQ